MKEKLLALAASWRQTGWPELMDAATELEYLLKDWVPLDEPVSVEAIGTPARSLADEAHGSTRGVEYAPIAEDAVQPAPAVPAAVSVDIVRTFMDEARAERDALSKRIDAIEGRFDSLIKYLGIPPNHKITP